jgi:hypothetical protein
MHYGSLNAVQVCEMLESVLQRSFQDVMAAGAPLSNILAHVITSQTDSSKPVQQACNLMLTCKAFQSAIKDCKGLLPLESLPYDAEEAAGFAGESSTSIVPVAE